MAEIGDVLSYDPETGLFRWKVSRGRCAAGDLAGNLHPVGYVVIRVFGRNTKAHRIAWLLMTGSWPNGEIDHRDKNKSNNRWANLRLATHGQNVSYKGANKNNRLGFKGVHREGNRFAAMIWDEGRSRWIGSFDTPEEASAAYWTEAQRIRGEFAHG